MSYLFQTGVSCLYLEGANKDGHKWGHLWNSGLWMWMIEMGESISSWRWNSAQQIEISCALYALGAVVNAKLS